MEPKISIITICYNSERHIEATIQSVLSQNYSNLQYIIIDGASKDNTMNIVNKYKSKIDTIISEPDKGISDAFNKGIKNATGELIGIVNSDDILLPNALKNIACNYEEGVYDIYRGNLIVWNDVSNNKFIEKPSLTFSKTPVFVHVNHESTFVTKEAYKKYGLYDVDLHYTMDLDFLVRAYKAGAKFKAVDNDFTMFRLGGATDTPMYKKKKDYIKLATNNGSNKLQANLYYAKLRTIDIVKGLLDRVNPDLKKMIRLQKMEIE